MSDTKICPFCGKEILAEAKKCRYCGEFIEKKCPVCGEWIDAKAKKCRHCGTWLNKFTKERYEGTIVSHETRKPQQETRSSSLGTKILLWIELIVASLLINVAYDLTWWESVLIGVACVVLIEMRITRILFSVAVSIFWGLLGLVLGPFIIGEVPFENYEFVTNEQMLEYWWLGLIILIIALSWHWPAFRADFES